MTEIIAILDCLRPHLTERAFKQMALIVEAMLAVPEGDSDQTVQGVSSTRKFLDAYQKFSSGELSQAALTKLTGRYGFN